jgi:hypothetical protein
MPTQYRRRILLISGMGALAGLLLGAAGCDAAAHSAPAPDAVRTAAATPSRPGSTRAPLWRVMLSAKAGAPAEEVDKFLKSEVIPALANNAKVGNASTFVAAEGPTYIVQLEVHSWGDPGANLAFEIFSSSRGASEAQRLQELFTKYFDARSASVLYYRPELSLSRGGLGKVQP